jgi:hypothetical protein
MINDKIIGWLIMEKHRVTRKYQKKQVEPKVTLNIVRGEVTPAQQEDWRRLWSKLLSEAKLDKD